MPVARKWNKDVEVSDDEDDTHPNVDTGSLNRWRHESRLLRQKELEDEKTTLEKTVDFHTALKSELDNRKNRGENVLKLLTKWMEEDEQLEKWKEQVAKKERLTPWNVDTIGTPGVSRTVINNSPGSRQKGNKKHPSSPTMTDEEREAEYTKFCKEYGTMLKKFGMFRRAADSKRVLMNHPNMVCHNTVNFLILWCIQLTVEEKMDLMQHVVRQAVVMKFLLEWASQLDMDPRGCIVPFFNKTSNLEEVTEFRQTVDKEVDILKRHVLQKAEQIIIKQSKLREEEEEKLVKLGPGGLNPLQVLRSLPPQLKICFEKSDVQLLQKTLQNMPATEANECMKRCVDSGLWVPAAADTKKVDTRKPNQWLAIAIALVALMVSLILPWTWFHMKSS